MPNLQLSGTHVLAKNQSHFLVIIFVKKYQKIQSKNSRTVFWKHHIAVKLENQPEKWVCTFVYFLLITLIAWPTDHYCIVAMTVIFHLSEKQHPQNL